MVFCKNGSSRTIDVEIENWFDFERRIRASYQCERIMQSKFTPTQVRNCLVPGNENHYFGSIYQVMCNLWWPSKSFQDDDRFLRVALWLWGSTSQLFFREILKERMISMRCTLRLGSWVFFVFLRGIHVSYSSAGAVFISRSEIRFQSNFRDICGLSSYLW